MAMRAQTSSKDEVFQIYETSETVIEGQLYASRLPIPDGFWVVWEGPPIAHTHLETVPYAVVERG